MYPTSSEGLNKETDEAVYFFTPAFHPLDNCSAHTVRLWGMTFSTVEHAFHWRKFFIAQPDVASAIFDAPSPHAAMEITHKHKAEVPSTWYDERVAVMEEILTAKAVQHDDVRDALRRTGTRTIIENSPVDSFWGAGADGKGENMVGKIWMKIRDSLS